MKVLRLYTLCLMLSGILLVYPSIVKAQCLNPPGSIGEIVYNESRIKFQGCKSDNNWQALHGDMGIYIPYGIVFDGSTNILNTSSTGLVNSDEFTLSFWIMPTDESPALDFQIILNGGTGSQDKLIVALDNGTDDNDDLWTLYLQAKNTSNANVVEYESDQVISSNTWSHVLISVDASSSIVQVYINDVLDTNYISVNPANGDINFNVSEYAIGEFSGGGDTLNASLSDLWFETDYYTDLSVITSRREFIDADNNPVNLNIDGTAPTGSAPDIFLSGSVANWHTNKGTSGGFTLSGILTESDSIIYQPGTSGPLTNLIGWWKLNETSGTVATDSSIQGNNGTMSGGLDPTIDSISGVIQNALNFGGSIHRVILVGDNIYDEMLDITVCAWVRRQTGSGWGIITGKTSDGANGWNLYVNNGNGRWGFMNTDFRYEQENVDIMVLNEWTHICGSSNGATSGDAIKLYKNGEFFVGSFSERCSSSCPDQNDSAYNLTIGRSDVGSGASFAGDIDEVRVYNRVLTEIEIAEIYNLGADCRNPTGSPGEIIYNSSENIFQGCTNSGWVALHEAGSGGGGCLNPAGSTGEIIYNTSFDFYQGCTVDGWFALHQ